jgi:hypothetical protein
VLASVLSNKNNQSSPVSCSIHLFEDTSPIYDDTYSIYGYFWNKHTNDWGACSLNSKCRNKPVDCCYIKRTCDFDRPIENGCPYYSCECAKFDVNQVINSDGICGTIPTSTFLQ